MVTYEIEGAVYLTLTFAVVKVFGVRVALVPKMSNVLLSITGVGGLASNPFTVPNVTSGTLFDCNRTKSLNRCPPPVQSSSESTSNKSNATNVTGGLNVSVTLIDTP